MDSVAVLDQDIKKAIINKEAVIYVFLDIEKAYDSMWREGVLMKLHDAGVHGRMFYWIKDFLNHRTIQVRIEGIESEIVEVENGTPQGSVISPVLFNVMINDIFENAQQGFGKSLFADDGALWRRGKNMHHMFCQTQQALDQVVKWADKWGFKISAPKSKFMFFGQKRKVPLLNLTMYGSSLERVSNFKFLGVWLGERLTWRTHIDKTIFKCEKIINIL